MREKIRQLAKENFQYELPKIILSKDSIEFSVESGKLYKDSLFISNSEKIPMKGLIYCTCPYVKAQNKSFFGRETELVFSICVKGKNPGEMITGELILVSDCGEKRVPVSLKVVSDYADTSLGELRDLFQFTNLARTSPKEAVKLFAAPEFKRIFLRRNASDAMLYKSLIKSSSKSHAMEEFLISINKKKRIVLEVETNEVVYERPEEAFLDKVILKKDTWGYEEIRIQSNAEFLKPAAERIWTDAFAGNQYELEYVIDPQYLKRGNNYGRLEIITANEKLHVNVTIKSAEENKKCQRMNKLVTLELFQNYLNFRLGQIDIESYVTEGKAVLEKHGMAMETFWRELVMAQLTFLGDKQEECAAILAGLKEQEEELKNNSEVAYCAYWYLKALQEGTKETIEQAVIVAEVCYSQTRKWQTLWMLLYLDKKYEIGELKLQAILEQLEAGGSSPILYFELCHLYNQKPTRLKELTKENIAALHWGVKMNYISEKLALQYAILAGKMAGFHNVVYHDMEILYGIYEIEEILTGICTMLVRGEKAGKKYFQWYQSGVGRQLKITNLYEYYMYSLEEGKVGVLPPGILHYFLYDSRLNDKKKAFLYRYIVDNKEDNASFFDNYEKQIRRFTMEQLEKGNNDENLSVLYEEIFREGFFMEKLLSQMVKVMFQYQIVCPDTRMKGVCVIHKEMEKEDYIPLGNGKAILRLYTEGARFVFVDEAGRRYSNLDENAYSVHKLNHLERYMEDCYHMGDNSPELLLALCEKISHYHKKKDDSENIQKQTLQIEGLHPYYRKKLYKQLLEYYYENMQNEELEALLQDEDLVVPDEDQNRIIELCMICCLEEQALTALRKSGWEKVPINRIQKFLTLTLLQSGMAEKDDMLLEMAYHVLEVGKCSKILLKYLAIYYEGPASSMLTLWERCKELEDETEEGIAMMGYLEQVEEEILCKVLFAETLSPEYYPVFRSYFERGYRGQKYEKCEKHQLVKAFLAYSAYRYVLYDEMVHEDLFEILKAEIVGEDFEIGRIALLKYYSERKKLTEAEKEFSDFQIHQYMEKNMIFPFFAGFCDKMVIPQRIAGKYYVEYRTSPKKRVYIGYAFAGKEALKFTTEPMQQVYPGIFVKELVLFYNEELEYYIYEEENGSQIITKSDSVTMENVPMDAGENTQNLLNFMLLAREVQDEKTLLESMEEYIRRKHAVDSLFKAL